MIIGFGLIVLGYGLFYWGVSHFCNCLGTCWSKDCSCQRYSLFCLLGINKVATISDQQTNGPLASI